MQKRIFLVSFIILAVSITAFAHAVLIEFNQHSPVVVMRAGFSKTSAMKNAAVEVFAPENGALYQSGQTDASGRFAFVPDAAGTWTVKVDDGRGHRKTASYEVTASFFETQHVEVEKPQKAVEKEIVIREVKTEQIPLIYRLVFGLSIIFGITGIFYGLKAKKK